MATPNIIERLTPVFQKVDRQIAEHLSSDIPFIMEASEHILFSGGKHLRPVLFVLAAQLCEYPGDREYYFSSVFEYLHAATLLHDDVVDESDTRRGRQAAHKIYGNKPAILVGDYLLAKSMAIAAETGRLIFFEVMSGVVARMAEGEVLQLLHARDINLAEEDYEQVIYRKTGILIESACYLGAVFAEAPTVQTMALKTFGRKIGLAFQIIDDCLDYSGTSAEFGKPVGHDLDEGKITLPLLRTLAAANSEDKDCLARLISLETRTPDEWGQVKSMIDKYHGLDQAVERASQLVEEAKIALRVFPDGYTRKNICDLADYIVTRRK
jgi:octaprenyl-diphosphate synthase